jgi:hypothetical protein
MDPSNGDDLVAFQSAQAVRFDVFWLPVPTMAGCFIRPASIAAAWKLKSPLSAPSSKSSLPMALSRFRK